MLDNCRMMRIGELATATGETVKTLRFWEEHGMLEAERSDSGYRYFSREMVARAGFVRQAQTLGFSLSEVRGILELRDEGVRPCDDVRARLRSHLEIVQRRLAELKALELELEARLSWAETHADPPCEDACIYLGSNPLGN